MTRRLRVIFVSLISLLVLPLAFLSLVYAQATPQKSGSTRPVPPPMPESDQTTNIPYFTLRDGMSSTLTLNNVAATPTAVTVTIFNKEGRAQALDPINMDLLIRSNAGTKRRCEKRTVRRR